MMLLLRLMLLMILAIMSMSMLISSAVHDDVDSVDVGDDDVEFEGICIH